jgi:hypothetical protein
MMIIIIIIIIIIIYLFQGPFSSVPQPKTNDTRLSVITTPFPPFLLQTSDNGCTYQY